MFDYSLAHWTAFLLAAVLLNLAPGPDMAYILGHTARGGRKAGFAAMFGIWSGAFIHVLMASAGLSAIIAASAMAFEIIKWVGAGYLIWIGLQAILSKGESLNTQETPPNRQQRSIFWGGVMVAAMNPKVAIFFLAFLPQFVVPGAGPTSAQLFLHGSLIIMVAALVEPPLVMAGARITKGVRDNPKLGLWMDRTLGALLIGLGCRLALVESGSDQ